MSRRTRRTWLACVGGLVLAGPLAAQTPPAANPVPPPAAPRTGEASPPVGDDFPLWLRPPGSVVEGGEPRSESQGERRPEREIETDRDSFTPAVSTVSKNRLIFESAYSFTDHRGVPESHSFPESLIRYGLTDRIELRLGWNYEVGGAPSSISSAAQGGDVAEGARIERESTLSYGFKVLLNEQNGWLPASVMILQGTTPTSGEATATQVVATSAWGWELPNHWKIDAAYRCGTGSETGDHFYILAPSVVLKVPVGEKIAVHAEYFGLFSRDKEQDFVEHFISPGVHYLVTPNLEVGVRVGWGLNDQSAKFFSNVGVGWQF